MLNEEETGTLSLSPFFNKAFSKALKIESFIKVTDEEAVKQEEIIIDKTGLSKIIGGDKFLEILNSEKHLPSEDIGVSPNPLVPKSIPGLELGRKNTIAVSEEMQSSRQEIFAGGDIVRGGATVILAMGDGRRAALNMDKHLRGE